MGRRAAGQSRRRWARKRSGRLRVSVCGGRGRRCVCCLPGDPAAGLGTLLPGAAGPGPGPGRRPGPGSRRREALRLLGGPAGGERRPGAGGRAEACFRRRRPTLGLPGRRAPGRPPPLWLAAAERGRARRGLGRRGPARSIARSTPARPAGPLGSGLGTGDRGRRGPGGGGAAGTPGCPPRGCCWVHSLPGLCGLWGSSSSPGPGAGRGFVCFGSWQLQGHGGGSVWSRTEMLTFLSVGPGTKLGMGAGTCVPASRAAGMWNSGFRPRSLEFGARWEHAVEPRLPGRKARPLNSVPPKFLDRFPWTRRRASQ